MPSLVAAGYQVATFDNRGVEPSSSPPAPYSVEGMAADTIVLLDHLGWVDPVRIAGHSMGGWIAETLVLEGAGAVGVAALRAGVITPGAADEKTVVLLSGRNVAPKLLSEVLHP